MFATKRRTIRLAGAAVVAVAATAVTVVLLTTGGATATDSTARPSAEPLTAPTYAAVAASAQEPTSRVRAMLGVIAKRFDDVDPGTARGVKAADGTQAWVAQGARHVCFGAENGDGTGYSCATVEAAARGELASAAADDGGSVHAVYLVPDDITRLEVGGASVPAVHNLAVVDYPRGATITQVHRDGGRTQLLDR